MARPRKNMVKVTISLPPQTREELFALAHDLGWDASDVVSHALLRTMPELRRHADLARERQQRADADIPMLPINPPAQPAVTPSKATKTPKKA